MSSAKTGKCLTIFFLLSGLFQRSIAEPNQSPTADAGKDRTVVGSVRVVLDGRASSDPDGNIAAWRWKQIQPTSGSGIVALTGITKDRASFTAPLLNTAQNLIFRLRVTDNQGSTNDDTVTVKVAATQAGGKLNDTGITLCGDYAYAHSAPYSHDANLDCSLLTDDDGDPIPPENRMDGTGRPTGQDAHVGRDASVNNDSNGHAGFSFSKVNAKGEIVSATATKWSCVKDNVTGLIWEVKTNDNGLHDKDWTYTWYEPDNTKNGNQAGIQNGGQCGSTSRCDTSGYVEAVNSAGWCGFKDWRMPGVNELQSIADMGFSEPAIDQTYFPNTNPRGYYWSGTPYADNVSGAWNIYFGDGVDGWENKGVTYYHVINKSPEKILPDGCNSIFRQFNSLRDSHQIR